MALMLRLLALSVLLLAGCANRAPTVPADYRGPLAYLKDTGVQAGGTSAQLFYLSDIGGAAVYSSVERTRKENAGRGLSLRLRLVQHTLPARATRVKLVGTHVTGAPIHELALRATGKFVEVTREVSFTPEPDGEYRVTGSLQPDAADVWIEDARTSRRVSEAAVRP